MKKTRERGSIIIRENYPCCFFFIFKSERERREYNFGPPVRKALRSVTSRFTGANTSNAVTLQIAELLYCYTAVCVYSLILLLMDEWRI